MASKTIAFWPGLPELWYRGELRSLSISIIFAVSFNMAILGTFVWPLWFDSWMIRLLWCALIFASCFSFFYSRKSWAKINGTSVKDSNSNQRFVDAQRQYLHGNYFEAEAIIQKILADGHQDIEAVLLLVSILRRTRRCQQALQWIERIKLCEKASFWMRELQAEKQQVEALLTSPETGEQLPAGA
jgi:hypothetical protein